ncbi:protocadherin gamma-A12-like [Tiliqua scincoides]|uniref:protocadherin gamma-A12-like n=1 Tax=Tiliqua scincoides TaxID=71010 RepID=UPI003462959F
MMVTIWEAVSGNIYYSIPEEIQKGSIVGNIAKEMGLDIRALAERGVHIVSQGRTQYFALNFNSGHLYTTQRIDREEICGQVEKCVLNVEIIDRESMKIYGVEIEVMDINDNAPCFSSDEMEIKISENKAIGSRFAMHEAQDADLGINSLQDYKLSSSSHFSLNVKMAADGARYPELVLEKSLDREEAAAHYLVLTAYDGGNPVRSGTANIRVVVLDANDNAPVFGKPLYTVTIMEDAPIGSHVLTVQATDLDEGINKEVKYSFRKITGKASQIFHLDSTTGEITLAGSLDYEKSTQYEIEVQAQDGGDLFDTSKVVIGVTDVNDHAPELAVTSLIASLPEDSPKGTVVALLHVQDQDSGNNGETACSVPRNLPFRLKKSYNNYYSLVLEEDLDRESMAAYNVTIKATDQGNPPRSTSTIIHLQVLDTNDNPPLFPQSSFTSYITENNQRSVSIFSLKASDPDWHENSKITYSIESQANHSSLSSYLSINSETGVVYALCSFDYEEFREIQFQIRAQDGGSPPLSSNVSVTLFILDQNDNVPEILYPSPPTDSSTGVELAPRSSEPGYLVTKVVAVDADSGQNGWLSYQLLKATEPGLFTVGLHTGETRTTRFFLEKDVLKQSLVVLVKDNGQPSLSASVTVTVVLADSIPEVLSDLSSISTPADSQSDLTFYLVVAVAFVSCLFFAFLLVLLAIRLQKWRNSPQLFDTGSGNISGVPVSQFVGIDGVRAFLHCYCHEVSMTTDSRKSNFHFPKENSSNTLKSQQPCEIEAPILIGDDLNITDGNQTVVEVS